MGLNSLAVPVNTGDLQARDARFGFRDRPLGAAIGKRRN
jgi:hypothetical protein